MNVLLDVVHPAHVHFFRHMRRELLDAGHRVEVVAREKDVTRRLLDAFDIPHQSIGESGEKGPLGQGIELARRDVALYRFARRFRPDVVLTRNPAGVQVARALRTTGVFDTDDGKAAGVHFWAAFPFAHLITTPACFTEDYGRRHRRYDGYKALAYLHPNRFTPDPTVREELGLGPNERYSIVRFVAFHASHDRAAAGLDADQKRAVVDQLRELGPVFVSSEGPLPPDLEPFAFRVAPHRLHDALAGAAVYVGDSQTVIVEAALLGVPALHCSSWSGRLPSLVDLDQRYALIDSFPPAQHEGLFRRLKEICSDPDGHRDQWRARRDAMLDDTVDVTSWYVKLAQEAAKA